MIERFVVLAVLGSLVFRFATGQWPWAWWQARNARGGEKQARVLLGLAPDAGREAIIDAHRRLLTQVHPDRGGTSDAVFEANAARDLLLERLGPGNRAAR
ncbi:molecular chaperone DnaJ [Novosphingobium sp.]|uniref:molecular chaperone DnaJ n=1 Tax=Novosphingobium sp. TaxID=1874826 RepID=UPI003B5248F7